MPDRGHHPHFSLGSDTEPTPAGAVYPPEPSPTLINHAGEGYRNGSFGVRDGILKERTGDGEQTTSYPPATSSTDHTSSIKKAWLRLPPVPAFLAWAPPHNNWKGWRPVIRATVAAWCGLLLLLGKESGKTLGQASFLTLVGEWAGELRRETELMRALQSLLSVPPRTQSVRLSWWNTSGGRS